MADWFDALYSEFQDRHAAMFAFSNAQVSEQFAAWDEPAPTFPLQGWQSVGAGLIVRADVAREFLRRFEAGHAGYLATLPRAAVRYVGEDYWSHPTYAVVSADDGAPVTVGQVLADVSMRPPREATELHSVTGEGEPISTVAARFEYVPADAPATD